jgi:hypothetical protein
MAQKWLTMTTQNGKYFVHITLSLNQNVHTEKEHLILASVTNIF